MAPPTPDEIRAELADALTEWRRHDPRMERATCRAEHGEWVDLLLDSLTDAVG